LVANISQSKNVEALSVYTPVHISDFSTETIGDWYESRYTAGTTTPSGSWAIAGNKLTRTSTGGYDPLSVLAQPVTGSVQNGKVEVTFTKDSANLTAPTILARYDDVNTHDFYRVWGFWTGADNMNFQVRRCAWGVALGSCATHLPSDDYTSGMPVGTTIKMELEIEDIAANVTELTLNLYKDGAFLRTLSVLDTGTTIPAGKWGVTSYGTASFDQFALYDGTVPPSTELTITPSAENIKYGNTITYTVADDEAQTVTFTDNGAGGTFSPSATVDLTTSPYNATVTYTPARSGDIVINVTSSGLANDYESNVFVSPYSTTIGFIGDSITSGVANNGIGNIVAANKAVDSAVSDLGSGFFANNKGINGSTTQSWLSSIDANAASLMSGGVEVVSIMLGTNDCGSILTADYKSNLQTIIDRLHIAGIRKVILQNSIYRVGCAARLPEYHAAIAELVTENNGYVLQGDTSAYEYFANNQAELGDGVHPSEAGHVTLGAYWANAIKSNLEREITPTHSWSASDNSFTLGETSTLTHTIDKYYGEFTGVVKVNGATSTNGTDYTASEGSTVIELLNSYLNTLGVGTYTLSVQFAGGVWVDTTFTISAAGVITPTPTNPNAPATPSAPNTGLFGTSLEATVAGLSVLTAIAAFGLVLLGRKLALNRK
jgi:lysophospholipase L1-like esterase